MQFAEGSSDLGGGMEKGAGDHPAVEPTSGGSKCFPYAGLGGPVGRAGEFLPPSPALQLTLHSEPKPPVLLGEAREGGGESSLTPLHKPLPITLMDSYAPPVGVLGYQ